MNKDKFELKVNSNSVSWNAKSVLKLADENQKKFDKEREKYVKEIEKLKANGGGVSFINEKKPAEVMKLQKNNIDSYTPKFLKIDIQKLQEILKTKFSKFSDIALADKTGEEFFNGFVLTGVGADQGAVWVRNVPSTYSAHLDYAYDNTGVSLYKSFYTITRDRDISYSYYGGGPDGSYIELSNYVYLPGFDTFSSDVKFVLLPITLGNYYNVQGFFEHESLLADSDVNHRFPEPYSADSTINIANDLIELYPKFQECLSLVEGIE